MLCQNSAWTRYLPLDGRRRFRPTSRPHDGRFGRPAAGRKTTVKGQGMESLRSGGFAAALVAAVCLWPSSQLRADEWPSRPVKIVVAFAPGGSADQFGRLIATELSA